MSDIKKISARIDWDVFETLQKRSKQKTAQGVIDWLIEEERRLRHKVMDLQLKSNPNIVELQNKMRNLKGAENESD